MSGFFGRGVRVFRTGFCFFISCLFAFFEQLAGPFLEVISRGLTRMPTVSQTIERCLAATIDTEMVAADLDDKSIVLKLM